MPETIRHTTRQRRPAGHLHCTGLSSTAPSRFTQLYRLVRALATGRVTQTEFDQHMDFYLGLNMLNGKTDNLITRRLWAGLWLPLGFIQCTDEQWRHISTIAQYGKRNPKGKNIMLAIANRLAKEGG